MTQQGLSFHHVGLACSDLVQEVRKMGVLGYELEGGEFIDPLQGVQGQFLGSQEPRLELLTPLGVGGALEPWLKNGVKLYHLAYETPDLDDAIARQRRQRAKLVVNPVPAVAFQGRRIAFLMLPNMLLIELVSAR